MKALNPIKFVAEAAERVSEYKASIKAEENFDKAKRIGAAALGYTDCMVTFLNTMIDAENNDFTGELDEVISGWQKAIYQAVIDKADETHQDHDTIWKLLVKRDEI